MVPYPHSIRWVANSMLFDKPNTEGQEGWLYVSRDGRYD